jgi:hypothetical protein
MSDYSRKKALSHAVDMFRKKAEEFRSARKKQLLRANPNKKSTASFRQALVEKRKLEGTWIIPKNLGIYQSVQGMAELTLPLDEFLETCVQSLSVNKNATQLRTLSQKWKTDGWMRLLFGRIWRISHTKTFTEKWTSYLGASPANLSLTQGTNAQMKTSGFYTQVFLKESGFANRVSSLSKTLMDLLAVSSKTPDPLVQIQEAFYSISCGILRAWDTKVISSAVMAQMSVFPLGEGVYLLGQSGAISTIKKHYDSLLIQAQSASNSRSNPLLTKGSLGNPLVLPNSFEVEGEPIQIEAMTVNEELLSRDKIRRAASKTPYDVTRFRNWSAPTANQSKNINNKKPVSPHPKIDRLRMYAAEAFLREYLELNPGADLQRFGARASKDDPFFQVGTWEKITDIKGISLSLSESLMGLPFGWTDPYLGWEFVIPPELVKGDMTKTEDKKMWFLLEKTGNVPTKKIELTTRLGQIDYEVPIPEEAFEKYLQEGRTVSDAVDELRIENNRNIRASRMGMVGNGVCPQVAYLGIDACFKQILSDRGGTKTFKNEYLKNADEIFKKSKNALLASEKEIKALAASAGASSNTKDLSEKSQGGIPPKKSGSPSSDVQKSAKPQRDSLQMSNNKLVIDAVSLIVGSHPYEEFSYVRDSFTLSSNPYKIYDYSPSEELADYKAIENITAAKFALETLQGNFVYFYHPIFGFLSKNIPLGLCYEDDLISTPGLLSISSLSDLEKLIDHSAFSHSPEEILAKMPQGSKLQLYLQIDPTIYLSVRQNLLRPLYTQYGNLPIEIVWGVPRHCLSNPYSFTFPDLPLGVRKCKSLASEAFVFEIEKNSRIVLESDTTDLKIDEIVLYSLLFQNYTFKIDFPEAATDIFVLFVGFKTIKANKSNDCYRTFYAPYLTTTRPNQPTTVLDNVDPKLFYQKTPDKPFLPCVFKYSDLGIDRDYLDTLKKGNKIFTFIFLLMQTVLKEDPESGIPETLWRFILKNEEHFSSNPLDMASSIFTNYISAIPNPAWKIFGK